MTKGQNRLHFTNGSNKIFVPVPICVDSTTVMNKIYFSGQAVLSCIIQRSQYKTICGGIFGSHETELYTRYRYHRYLYRYVLVPYNVPYRCNKTNKILYFGKSKQQIANTSYRRSKQQNNLSQQHRMKIRYVYYVMHYVIMNLKIIIIIIVIALTLVQPIVF